MKNFSFGRRDGRTERDNYNISELSLENVGIIIDILFSLFQNKTSKSIILIRGCH